MYVGRIVTVGKTDQPFAAYRVSSRSFPNRQAVETSKGIAIVPRPGHENDVFKNPYIAYNCLRVVKGTVVVTNGSHTDPIAEKIDSGMSPRDALALTLLTMDYEKDDYNTPRIAGVVQQETGYLALVRHDGIEVQSFPLVAGKCRVVATYELDHLTDREYDIDAPDAEACARFVVEGGFFGELEHPVCSAALHSREGHTATYNLGM